MLPGNPEIDDIRQAVESSEVLIGRWVEASGGPVGNRWHIPRVSLDTEILQKLVSELNETGQSQAGVQIMRYEEQGHGLLSTLTDMFPVDSHKVFFGRINVDPVVAFTDPHTAFILAELSKGNSLHKVEVGKSYTGESNLMWANLSDFGNLTFPDKEFWQKFIGREKKGQELDL